MRNVRKDCEGGGRMAKQGKKGVLSAETLGVFGAEQKTFPADSLTNSYF